MNVNFQTANKGGKAATTEWYTPQYIIESLGGKFDLDPCAPAILWYTAHKCYTKEIDGLSQKWEGRVFLNPPYENPVVKHFVRRLADHNNGIALLYARCDNKMFFEDIFNRATSIKFLRDRIYFIRPDGTKGDRPGCGSVLISYGKECDEILRKCSLPGKYIQLINS
ncbi:DNA N-6-adenine-methyltransferase [Parabacteroides pacaensis]|uniref:DNA N-6-adenine-methyltransferase n=1 Tax=Parabacteroides pacaensis TaxID=2086575 RepID=UPI000D100CDD|nr:DNA N-6-adenine-methyltransferase [Parabacteroides pacaensis]